MRSLSQFRRSEKISRKRTRVSDNREWRTCRRSEWHKCATTEAFVKSWSWRSQEKTVIVLWRMLRQKKIGKGVKRRTEANNFPSGSHPSSISKKEFHSLIPLLFLAELLHPSLTSLYPFHEFDVHTFSFPEPIDVTVEQRYYMLASPSSFSRYLAKYRSPSINLDHSGLLDLAPTTLPTTKARNESLEEFRTQSIRVVQYVVMGSLKGVLDKLKSLWPWLWWPFLRTVAFYDLLSLHRSCLILDVPCKLENPCQQSWILHLHRGMNPHCLRKHHHLRHFLSRWSRNYLWRLPVPSPTVANARLINLRSVHTRRGSYSYNVRDARIGMLFF